MPVESPEDKDGDGIDDVFELSKGSLNPLDSADSFLDPDADGWDNFLEYA